MSMEEAERLALYRGHHWRVEIFDAQLGGSIHLYFFGEDGASQCAIRTGGWVQSWDGDFWVDRRRAS